MRLLNVVVFKIASCLLQALILFCLSVSAQVEIVFLSRQILIGFVHGFRLALSAGFLCWQTDNGRQNDALMAGALASLETDWFTFGTELGGYFGWENDGDRPVRTRLRLDVHPWEASVHPFVQCGVGLADYPFTQIRAGVAWSL